MQKFKYTFLAAALTLGLAAAPAARANDAFGDAHDDAPAGHVERGSAHVPFALAPDAHDDSGLSADSFQRRSVAEPMSGFAFGPDAHDDAGIGASEVESPSQSGA
jgi:hypothetical protein